MRSPGIKMKNENTMNTFSEAANLSRIYAISLISRITSYNVCYTKLLRLPPFQWPRQGRYREARKSRPLQQNARQPPHVITSYSIHYTKLYECARRMLIGSPPLGPCGSSRNTSRCAPLIFSYNFV